MSRRDQRAIALATGLLGIALTILTFTGPRGLLSGDEGVKLIQAFGVLDHGLDDPYLPYPAGAFDPQHLNHPVVPPHVVVRDGKRYGIYPITFTAPSAGAWAVGGFWALHVLPLAGGILAVWMTMQLGLLAIGDRRWAIGAGVLVATATPLPIYAATFNEHALGVGLFLLGLWGLAVAARPASQVAGGAALALAATLRPELIAAAPAVAVFVFVYHGVDRAAWWRLMRATAGATAVFGAFLLYNHLTTGVPLPGVAANRAANRPTGLSTMLPLLYSPGLGLGHLPLTVLTALGVVGVVGLWPRTPRLLGWLAGGASVTAFCAIAFVAIGQVTPGTGDVRTAVGLFTTTPLLVVAALATTACTDERRRRVLACVGCGTVATIAIFLTNADRQAGGLQFGARHLLVAAPLFTLGAVAVIHGARHHLATRALAIAAVLLTAWASVQNLRAWRHIQGEVAAINVAAERSGTVDVFSSFFWAPEVLAPLWRSKRVSQATYLWSVIDQLEKSGITEVTQVLGGLERLATRGRLEPVEILDAKRHVIRYRIVPWERRRDDR